MIRTTKDIKVIGDILSTADQNALILIDIDDTVIMNKSKMFRFKSKHRGFVGEIKKDHAHIADAVFVFSNWRLMRKALLVSNDWTSLIDTARANTRNTYALTQMDSGKFGNISSVELWRYNELSSLGIHFNEQFNNKDQDFILAATDEFQDQGLYAPTIFYKGFFMTGANKKGNVTQEIIKRLDHTPSKVIFIDDRRDHAIDVSAACGDIPHECIVYRGIELYDDEPDEKVVEFQKEYLLKNLQWLEDDEAKAMLVAK